jgi:hypothetical protein
VNQNHANLLARLPANPRTTPIRTALTVALTGSTNYATRKVEMASSGKFTESGITAAVRDMLTPQIREQHIATAPVRALKRDIAAKRDALRPAEPDPANFAAAIAGTEYRGYMRSLKPLDRDALLLTTSDIRLLEAALSAPPELSGFSASDRDTIEKVEQHYVRLKHPNEVVELETLDELLAEAEAIAQVARDELRRVAGLSAQEFEAEAKKIEAAVWLVGEPGNEQVCEPGPDGTATYRVATSDEVSSGVRYASAAEYYAARAA